jgi:type I restriction enzyme, S subunit
LAAEPTPYKMIRTTNVRNGFIDTDNVRYVDEDVFRRWTRRAVPLPRDVVLTREAPLGEVGIIRNPEHVFLGQRTIMYRADPAKLDPYFLMYSMLSDYMQGQILSYGSGATVEHMRLPDCFNLLLPLPPLPTQRKIAAILSAYDDLIENNNRRIRLLEEMVQRVYREWFVDFRYPGHEDVPVVDSDLGSIPEGWNAGTLADLVDINASTIRKIQPDEAIRYVDIASVHRGVVDQPKRMLMSQAPGRARRRVADGDTIWSTVRPNLRAYALLLSPGSDCVASTGFAVLSPRHASFAYVYAMTTADEFVEYLASRATGSAYPAVTPPVFATAPAVVPPADIMQAYAELGEPLMRLASTLGFQIAALRAARDLLLPRLISGDIDVADLDIQVPEAAA